MIKYKVSLTEKERAQLLSIISKGNHSEQQYRTAYILLNCDDGKFGQKIINEKISSV
jgi:hypothetical protein